MEKQVLTYKFLQFRAKLKCLNIQFSKTARRNNPGGFAKFDTVSDPAYSFRKL